MGRAISFISAITITLGGIYLLAVQLSGSHWHGVILLTAVSMLGFGVSWLWVDFVSAIGEEISTPDRGR